MPISTQLYWQLAYQVDTGRLHAGARLPTVRELGAVLRVNPNTVRSVYRRLADAGYVVSRQGAGTRVAARPPIRRTTGVLDGLVAELLRTAARAGYSADEVASAVYAAATERRRPGPLVHVLFVECTAADARRAAERISEAFDGVAEADGALIDRVVERLERHHYDLVATSTFHADETVALVAGRAPGDRPDGRTVVRRAPRRDPGAARGQHGGHGLLLDPQHGEHGGLAGPVGRRHAPDRGGRRRRGRPSTGSTARRTSCS